MSKKPKNPWQREIDLARKIVEPLGFTVTESSHAYEIAVVSGNDVQIMIYPHTVSSTRNQHARVRDHGSKNKAK